MPPKKKAAAPAQSEGVDVRAPRGDRYEGGVSVRKGDAPARTIPVVPEQTAGSENGHSAENKEKD